MKYTNIQLDILGVPIAFGKSFQRSGVKKYQLEPKPSKWSFETLKGPSTEDSSICYYRNGAVYVDDPNDMQDQEHNFGLNYKSICVGVYIKDEPNDEDEFESLVSNKITPIEYDFNYDENIDSVCIFPDGKVEIEYSMRIFKNEWSWINLKLGGCEVKHLHT